MHSDKGKLALSIVVLTFSEEQNINKLLKFISRVHKIIIIDSGSTDKTLEIARKYTNKIYYHKFENYANQRNFALTKVTTPWVLMLDADETLSPGAKEEIERLIKNKEVDGYWFPRRNYINDKKYLKHGYFYPDYQFRLFRNKKGLRYEGAVHEQPVCENFRTKKVKYPEIYHNPSRTKYDSFFSLYRFFPFVKIEGNLLLLSSLSNIELLKTGFVTIARDWWRSFVRLKGYKDGYAGFRAASVYALYRGMIYFYAFLKRLSLAK